MKTLELSKASRPLADYAHDLGGETIILVDRKRPVAALVSLHHIDRETLSLSTSPEFLRIIEESRAQIRRGETLSLEEIRQQVNGKAPPNKALQRTGKARR